MAGVRKQADVLTELTISGARSGDRRAFELLYRQWQPQLSRFAARMTRNREASVDVMQDSWIAIARNLRRLEDASRFKGWAYRIVSNKCRDWIRKEQARRRLSDQVEQNAMDGRDTQAIHAGADSHDDGASDPVNDSISDSIRLLRKSLKVLSYEHRTILTLFYLEEWSVMDIGRLLDIPEGTVKSRLYHARKTLKRVLEDENND